MQNDMFSAQRRWRCCLPFLFSAALPYVSANAAAAEPSAQPSSASARLEGVVTDADQHPLGASTVRLLDANGHVIATTRSGSDGHFAVNGIAPGHYLLTATHGATALGQLSVDLGAGEIRTLHLAPAQINAVTVKGRREQARTTLSPATGSSQYAFDAKAIATLPQGDATPLNQVLLQAPGVANDSFGQLHIRGDHADLQYRINGVILPEGIGTFGQTLDTRFAQKIDLLTGALPAQYGYRTAGVVDITTKQHFGGGVIDLYGGSHATLNPSLQYGVSTQRFDGFFSGSYLSSKLGIESPTDAYEPLHDRTTQGKGFGYAAYQLAEHTKIAAIFGSAFSRFEIPNNPNQAADPDYLDALGLSQFDSTTLNERQFERTNYALVALQGVLHSDIAYQFAVFQRSSTVNYEPDPIGDLVYTGDASTIKRKSSTLGLQSDWRVPLGERHTLRAGLSASTEDDRADNRATVFTVDPLSNALGGPITLVDNTPKNGNTLLGLYLQDQWDLTEALTINYGLRYDRLNAYIDDQQLSPRLGVVWYATPATTVHAGYARYFTPPANELIASGSLQRFANTSNATENTRNDPVRAERSHYFDLGVLQQLSPAFSVGLDAYYKYVRNLQDEGQFGSALIFAPFNYDQGHIYGLELSSSYHQGNWSAYFNLARSVAQATNVVSGQFNFAQDELDYIASHYVYLDHDQRLSGSAGLSYTWLGTTLSSDATYGSGLRKDFANTGKLPPYLQIDLSATHAVTLGALGRFNLRLAALNVLDRTYLLRDGSGIGVGAPQYGPRAALYFGISRSFGG